MTSRESFDSLNSWYEELDTYLPNPETIKMVIGNKIDKEEERSVGREEGQNYAKSKSALFVECSAKSSVGVQQAFKEMTEKVSEYMARFDWRSMNILLFG